MKAIIVVCSDSYEYRVDLVRDVLTEQGYGVTIIQTDFRHIKKVHRRNAKEGYVFIKSKPYYSNISVSRIVSLYKYSMDAFKYVNKIKPDLLYVLVPNNSLAKFTAKYKQRHKDVKIIFDIIDLWPESLPIGKIKKILPLKLWMDMRNKSLKYANLVITECNLFQKVLSNELRGINTETLYWAKKEINVISNPQFSDDEIHLAYLGSINNIIDIPKIKEIIEIIKEVKPVTLHIVGDGEKRQELIDAAKMGGAKVEYHGKIYDSQEKHNVFDKCHYGLNIMKEMVCVGLTMKSVDYFQHGLPIINNISADTEEIVDKYGVGINVVNGLDSLTNKINENTNINSNINMRVNSLAVYNEKFSDDAIKKKLNSYLRSY